MSHPFRQGSGLRKPQIARSDDSDLLPMFNHGQGANLIFLEQAYGMFEVAEGETVIGLGVIAAPTRFESGQWPKRRES